MPETQEEKTNPISNSNIGMRQCFHERHPVLFEILKAILPAIVAIVGTIAGVTYTYDLNRQSWLQDQTLKSETNLLELRMDIFERANKILYKAEIFRTLSLQGKIDYELTKERVKTTEGLRTLESKSKSIVETKTSLQELYAEYATVMQLASTYFGPKTKQAVINLIKYREWWERPPSEINGLIETMASEINYQLKFYNN